ncbi:MAG: ComC/BlpC family leader-containing pheromone/bacteriocin [Bacteroidales bacterium]|nr:ComC/BlpC family leader-containing pheromone/bacteriocin [Bacteroidales bacterium]
MKTLKKMKQNRTLEGFIAIKAKHLQEIKGGEAAPLPRGSVL